MDNLALDTTPLPTDWDDLFALFADMKKFADEHPDHTFISADDPGMHYETRRAPRMGWVAFLKDANEEQAKEWTITLQNLKKSLPPNRYDIIAENAAKEGHREILRPFLGTAIGRQRLIDVVIGRPATPTVLVTTL